MPILFLVCRAYKLGKPKCSYNQVELLFYDLSKQNPVEMKISEAIETCIGSEVEDILKESCLKFNVRFLNNKRLNLYVYVVYDNAHADEVGTQYHWMPVTRANCKKGCRGPVIRGLRRFGKLSRRGDLYIAIDEASTHVCIGQEIPNFRFLFAAYNDLHELLGTTVSSSIRVLSNTDAPRGGASLKVYFNLLDGWKEDIPQTPRLSSPTDARSKDIELYSELIDGDQNPKEKADKNKKPTMNNSDIAVLNMPRLISEPNDGDEKECNRLIKRPRLCATFSTRQKNCASILSRESMRASSNPKNFPQPDQGFNPLFPFT